MGATNQKSSKEQLLELISQLKIRYSDESRKAYTMSDLEMQNPDISISRLTRLIKQITDLTPADYLMRNGILEESHWMRRYRESNHIEVGHEYLKNAFAEIEIKDIAGTVYYVHEDCGDERETIKKTLSHYGGSLENTFNDNVQYIVTGTSAIQTNSLTEDININAAISRSQLANSPVFINAQYLQKKAQLYYVSQIASMAINEKVTYAFDLFLDCVEQLNAIMEKEKEYTEPITSRFHVFSGVERYASQDEAFIFAEKIADYLKPMQDDIRAIRRLFAGDEFGNFFVNRLKLQMQPFSGYRRDLYAVESIYQALGIAVAYHIFMSPGASVYIEFAHNARDMRLNSGNGKRIFLTLSSCYRGIDVGIPNNS